MIIERIVAQHAEETEFLWYQRVVAVTAPHLALRELTKHDDRIVAHIDGLRVAGEAGWKICEEQLTTEESGAMFSVTVLALEAQQYPQRIETLLSLAESIPAMQPGLISAFGWVSWQHTQATVNELLTSSSPFRRRVGIASCAINRIDPGPTLSAGLNDADTASRARALRAVGELGREDLAPELQREFNAENEACQFWSAWSAVRLGDGAAVNVLKKFAEHPQYQQRATQMMLRCLPRALAESWLSELVGHDAPQRLVVQGMGIISDPSFIPALLQLMAIPEVARVAGESFTMITGLDLAYENFEMDAPKGFKAGPTENPDDEDVALDPDEDLPWPNPELVGKWWDANKSQFRVGQRYLLGQPIDANNAQRVLRIGRQRQRIAAALELAVMHPNQPLFETRAPGFRQQQLLK